MKTEIFQTTYRTGGWANATWNWTQPGSKAHAEKIASDCEKMGYKARIYRKAELDSIGCPIGFCRHANAITGEMTEKTCDCK